jgi:hypothetical protein
VDAILPEEELPEEQQDTAEANARFFTKGPGYAARNMSQSTISLREAKASATPETFCSARISKGRGRVQRVALGHTLRSPLGSSENGCFRRTPILDGWLPVKGREPMFTQVRISLFGALRAGEIQPCPLTARCATAS